MARLCWSYEPPFMRGKYRKTFTDYVKESVVERQDRLYGEDSMEGFSAKDLREYASYEQPATLVSR